MAIKKYKVLEIPIEVPPYFDKVTKERKPGKTYLPGDSIEMDEKEAEHQPKNLRLIDEPKAPETKTKKGNK